jgi:hypothetical protein
MWPLSVFLFLATVAPQQNKLNVFQNFDHLKLPAMQYSPFDDTMAREHSLRNTCYTMRSYFFRQQDGNPPVPAGMSTCIPANVTRQLKVSPAPRVKFVPLGEQSEGR